MAKTNPQIGDNVGREQLRSLVERIERVEEEQAAIAEDKKQIYAEAKGAGFDTKAIRRIIALRKRDAAEVEAEQAVFDLYLHALGMGPLFDGEADA